jgi:hypothetical protein
MVDIVKKTDVRRFTENGFSRNTVFYVLYTGEYNKNKNKRATSDLVNKPSVLCCRFHQNLHIARVLVMRDRFMPVETSAVELETANDKVESEF